MQTPKQEVIELLNKLPDTTTLEDIQYHIYVHQKIQQGMKDVQDGKTYSQEEVERSCL